MHPAHPPQPRRPPRQPGTAPALAPAPARVRTWLPALGLAWAACFSPGLAAQTLRAADIHNSDDYPTVAAVRYMGEWLSQRTGGRLKIKVFNKGALGTEKETIDQVKVGALDITRVNVSPMNALCAQTLVPALPYLFRSVAHMRRALDSPAGAEILRSCEPQGFVGLAFYDSGARSVYARKPLRGLADLQGLKIRVPPSELWVAMTAALGANATPMPLGEVYTGLKTGLIDAAENNVPSFEAFRHDEAARHYTRTEHSMAPEMLLMSKRRFERLSPADQALVREAAQASVAHQRRLWDEQEARSLALLKARGAQFHEIDTAALRARMAPVYARFIDTPALKALVQALQEVP